MIRMYLDDYYSQVVEYNKLVKLQASLQKWIEERHMEVRWGLLTYAPNILRCVYVKEEDAVAFIFAFDIKRYVSEHE